MYITFNAHAGDGFPLGRDSHGHTHWFVFTSTRRSHLKMEDARCPFKWRLHGHVIQKLGLKDLKDIAKWREFLWGYIPIDPRYFICILILFCSL